MLVLKAAPMRHHLLAKCHRYHCVGLPLYQCVFLKLVFCNLLTQSVCPSRLAVMCPCCGSTEGPVQQYTAANEPEHSSSGSCKGTLTSAMKLNVIAWAHNARVEFFQRRENSGWGFTYTKTPKSRTRMPISKASSRTFFLRSGGDTFMVLG